MVVEGQELDIRWRQLEMPEGECMIVVAVAEREHIASVEEEGEIERMAEEGIVNIVEDAEHFDNGVEGVAGRSSRHTAACRKCCTSAVDTGGVDADVDYIVFSFLYLAACLALPADDGHSSCRRG